MNLADDRRAALPPFKPLPMKAPDLDIERRPDGTILLTSRHAPGPGPRSIAHLLTERAAAHPDRRYMGQRMADGPWRFVTYGEAKRAADGIAAGLLARGLGPDDSVMVLSGNSIEHALVMLGCYTAGVPVAPISPAYSLISSDHAKLKHCFATVRPRLIFAQSGAVFARAFETLRAMVPDIEIVTADGTGEGALAALVATAPGPEVAAALDRLGADSVAKYLFTSGSTGMPKCVPQTFGMMAGVIAGQEGLRSEPANETAPEMLEWMPWSHISAGNIGFNAVLWNGATIYLDEGKPMPGLFDTTIKNLLEVSPSLYGSAPVAFAMLADAMERDPALRRSFFSKLDYMMYGGATLSNDIYERLQALAIAETGRRIPLTSMYGATETQGITIVHWLCEQGGLVGLPMPGITLKLVPNGSKLEVRVKGPTVASGYRGNPERTAEAFDEEGFYKLGDAVKFLDPENPAKGLAFDGRVTEDFKLHSGTWVSVGTLRPDLITACSPYIQDAVIAGQDKACATALFWPSPAGVQVFGQLPDLIRERLAVFNRAAGGSSRRIGRFIIMKEPPSLDAGEITDKGYVNQRCVQERRAALVAALYAEPPGEGVVTV